MNLLEDEQINTKSKNTKTIMIVIIVLIVFLVIISGVLLYLITTVENSTIKLNLDGQNKTFAEDMFLIEDDKLYIAIRDFGELMGYSSFNGDYKNRRYSENTSDCYISSSDEIASYSLNSNTMYKKVTENEDYEYFDLEEPVRFQNNKLYVIAEGMEIGTNCIIDFNPDNNQITVYSLNYLISLYSPQFPNAAIIADDADHTILSADKLSSGEQHIVILVYDLLFESEDDSIFLVDEPELSFHLSWQGEFLPAIKKIVDIRKIQCVFATHSAQIFQHQWQISSDLFMSQKH